MKKGLRIGLRISALDERGKEYFLRSILSFIGGWIWKKHEYETGFASKFPSIKLVKASDQKYVLTHTVGIEYTSQLFYIKDIRYYEKEV